MTGFILHCKVVDLALLHSLFGGTVRSLKWAQPLGLCKLRSRGFTYIQSEGWYQGFFVRTPKNMLSCKHWFQWILVNGSLQRLHYEALVFFAFTLCTMQLYSRIYIGGCQRDSPFYTHIKNINMMCVVYIGPYIYPPPERKRNNESPLKRDHFNSWKRTHYFSSCFSPMKSPAQPTHARRRIC